MLWKSVCFILKAKTLNANGFKACDDESQYITRVSGFWIALVTMMPLLPDSNQSVYKGEGREGGLM